MRLHNSEVFLIINSPEFSNIPKFRDYLTILRKRSWMITSIVVIFVGLVTIWNFKTVPVYRATVQILIEPDNPNVVSFQEVLGSNDNTRGYHVTQYRLIKSRELIKRVVEKLNLFKKEGFGISFKKDKKSLSEIIKLGFRSAVHYVRGLLPETKYLDQGSAKKYSEITPEDRAIGALLTRLEVEPVGKSRLVNVHFDNRNPRLATNIANTVADLYIEKNFDLHFTMTTEASGWLKKQIGKAKISLSKSGKTLQEYKEKHAIVSLEDQQNIVAQKLKELDSMATKARTERLSLEIMAKRIKKTKEYLKSMDSLSEVIKDPIVQKLKSEHVFLQRELSTLTDRYKPKHPKFTRLSSAIQLLERKIDKEKIKIRNNIIDRYDLALAREKSFSKLLKKQKEEALRVSRLAIQYQVLRDEVEANRKLYDSLQARTKETEILDELKTTNIRIVDRAHIPEEPISPRKRMNVLISLVVSLFFGVAFAFFVERVAERVRSPEEVESIVGVPALGTIIELGAKVAKHDPLLKLGGKSQTIGREHFHALRTMVVSQIGDKRISLITSCLPGEGKSFIAANLAMVMSKIGKKVLLIDGDMKRPKLVEKFGPASPHHLSEVILGEVEAKDAIYNIPDTSLHVLLSREYMGDSSVLLEKFKLEELLERLKFEFDYIFIDSPPVLSVSDPLIWSRYVDSILFVVDMQQINADLLKQATNTLAMINAPIVGTICNRLNNFGTYYYYGYRDKGNYY